MNFDESKLIFFTGAPGSKWSSISHLLTKNPKYPINFSDYNADRMHTHVNGISHQGAYWGPGNDLGENFHRLYRMSKDQIVQEIDRAYADKSWEKHRIVKCHHFALNLDFIKETFPNSKILTVMRNNRACYTSWMTSGGFDKIKYPNYNVYYKNPEELQKLICKENAEINRFVVENKLDIYVVYRKYFRDYWGINLEDPENELYMASLEKTITEKKNEFIYNIDISIAHYNF